MLLRPGLTAGALPCRGWRSPPSPMQPESLLRMFAYPAFDRSRDRLCRGLDVDVALAVARQRDFIGQFSAEMVAIRQPPHAHAAQPGAGQSRELDRERVCFRPATEKHDIDPLRGVLIDEERNGAA